MLVDVNLSVLEAEAGQGERGKAARRRWKC